MGTFLGVIMNEVTVSTKKRMQKRMQKDCCFHMLNHCQQGWENLTNLDCQRRKINDGDEDDAMLVSASLSTGAGSCRLSEKGEERREMEKEGHSKTGRTGATRTKRKTKEKDWKESELDPSTGSESLLLSLFL